MRKVPIPGATEQGAGSQSALQTPVASSDTGKQSEASLEARRRLQRGGRTRLWTAFGVVVLVGGLVLAVLAYSLISDPSLELPHNGTVAFLPFTANEAREAWMQSALPQVAARALAEVQGVTVLEPERVLAAVGPGPWSSVSEEVAAQRVRQLLALGAAWVIEVEMDRLDEEWLAEVRVRGASGVVSRARLQDREVLGLLQQLVFALSRTLAPEQQPTALAQLFPSSPFLFGTYGKGLAALAEGSNEEAALYLQICRREGPELMECTASLAELAAISGRSDTARELWLEVVPAAQGSDRRHLLGRALLALARIAARSGEQEEAEQLLKQAHVAFLGLDDMAGVRRVLQERARLARAENQGERAESLLFDLLALQHEAGDRQGEARSLLELGSFRLAAGATAEAEELLAEALSVAERLEDEPLRAQVRASLGEAARRRGDQAAVVEHWDEALRYQRLEGEPASQRILLRGLAQANEELEQQAAAEEHYRDLLELSQEHDLEQDEAWASLRLARLLLLQGYPFQAQTHLDRALELDRWLEDRAAVQRTVAWMAYERGNWQLALDILQRLRQSLGPDFGSEDEEVLATYRRALEAQRRLPLPWEGA